MKKKSILIIGAGPDQLPAIQQGKSLGYRVLTTDINPNAIGFRYADKYAIISTNDTEETFKYAKQQQIDAITTLVSETGVPVVGFVNHMLGLPGISPDLAYLATNKIAMRNAMLEAGCSIPEFRKISSKQEAIQFINLYGLPVVIKPSDSSGQSGITKIEHPRQLNIAVKEAIEFSTDSQAIIETYIEGSEINVTAIVNNSEITILSLSERVTAPPPPFWYCYPAHFSSKPNRTPNSTH